ncbi:hypothetical protein L3N51_00845 [Metallosphaera sp. J1]|uniref:hypothetical protein n=1 Tax=Metallosphaera javensis (ex Hofmann et al. 2022) TaxID=99938 RepID=UPI001EDD795F|nr:hypothetical protein [Metallosphaera javensis (ex Hofmann et al. 2022)]MCG3108563.1 hypothetical protein [Metallosphaera javensis (ex Hofmann et al. 2022)]
MGPSVLYRDLNASLNLLRRAGWKPSVEPVEMRLAMASLIHEAGSSTLYGGVAYSKRLKVKNLTSMSRTSLQN